MPTNAKRKRPRQRTSRGELVHRGRMLQSDEQRPIVPVEFLLEFTRNLIRTFPSMDAFSLAALSAERKVPLSKEQKAAFLAALLYEKENSMWPKGFF